MFIKEYLDNGIPVVMEPFNNVRSVCMGIWVKVGSRFEKPELSGISHFLEHMFFKGTKKRTSRDIAVEIDSVGGDLNAFTSRENTAFYVKVIDEYIEKGTDLLSDIFLNSLFPEEEFDKEKKIIKEEIKMVEDTPDDYIHDLFYQTIWGKEALGQSILGRRETIASFTRDDIINHIRRYYGTRDIVISCTGNFDPRKVIGMLNHLFGGLRRGSEPKKGVPPGFQRHIDVYEKDLSEAHLCIGLPALEQASDDRYSLFILNTILGAGVSSRLFQEIREKRGLAYSIYSFTAAYYDTGVWAVYAGVSRKRLREVARIIIDEMIRLKETLNEVELERAKKQLKGNMILGLESTSNRMNNIARQEIYFGKYFSPDEIMRSVDDVTLDMTKELADRLIRTELFSIAALGSIQKSVLSGIF